MNPVTSENLVPPFDLPIVATRPVVPELLPLIPPMARHPTWLWFTHVFPISLLLLCGYHAYSLVSGDLDADRRWDSAGLGAGLVMIAAVSGGVAWHTQRQRRLLSNVSAGLLLACACCTMVVGMIFCAYVIDSPQVPAWVLSTDELLYDSFCLGMPGAFYALLLLSSFPPRKAAPIRDLTAAFGLTIAVPLVMWGIFYSLNSVSRFDVPAWLGMVMICLFLFGGGTLLCGGIIRTTLLAYTGIRRLGMIWQQLFMAVIAIACPLGGLWLNQSIPFPVDFQAPLIYLLALVNGLFLMLPVVRSIFWHRVIWLLQCLLFPFSAYFFVVFLPWLVLTPFAMLAYGAGALMLAPLVLGLVHGYRLVDGYREEVRDGNRWKPALIGLLVVSALPAAMGWSMWQDRQSLDEALTYIYAPDYRKDVTYPGDLSRLESSLQHLRNMKHGVFLPFISPIYDAVVFHNLVLPDTKINFLQQAFFGTDAHKQANALLRSFSGDNLWNERGGGLPSTDALLEDVQVKATTQQAITTSRLTLMIKNPTASETEYVATIRIPEGVYVSDFGLYIGNQLVPGRVVEKKTALWVYEKIRVVQNEDPGLLFYKSRTALELHVFPVAAGETRRVEIELIHPSAGSTPVQIGDRSIELNPAAALATPAITACSTASGAVVVSEGLNQAAMTVQRKPYLHILIDCSRGTSYTAEALRASFLQVSQAFPDAAMVQVSAVNFDIREVVPDPIPIDKLDADVIQKDLLPSRGGFLQDRSLKRGLLQAMDRMQLGTKESLLRPQFVIISSQNKPVLSEYGLEAFVRLVPDARVIYTLNQGGIPQSQDMVTRHEVVASSPVGVTVWRWGNQYAVTSTEARMTAYFMGDAPRTGSPEFYDPASFQFTPVAKMPFIPVDSRYADGVKTWEAQDEADQNPSLLKNGAAALLGLSKQTRILVNDASYVVVETSSQWRIMEEKEKKKLQNNQVFELEEPTVTPEPSTWFLLLLGLSLLLAKRKLTPSRPQTSRRDVITRAGG